MRKIVLILGLILLAVGCQKTNQLPTVPATTPTQTEKHFRFTAAEAAQLTNELLAGTVPELTDNEYFTPLMKEKLTWVATEHAAGRLLINAVGSYNTDKNGQVQKAVLMTANYDLESGKPIIYIFTPRLLMLVRVQHNIQVGYSKMCKDSFALALTHEAVHLEREKEHFVNSYPSPQIAAQKRLEEEDRTWLKVHLGAVKPLLDSGHELEPDYVESDKILARCGYKRWCPAFMEYLIRGGKPTS